MSHMRLRDFIVAAPIMLASLFQPTNAGAATFRYAFQGDLNSLDPYALNETVANYGIGNVYEGLVARDGNLKIIPCLATSWEVMDPLHWRFHLRHGVKFSGGEDFTADDVVFSAARVNMAGSVMTTKVQRDAQVVKVDDYTVDFILKTPNPTLISEWHSWFIMSKTWAMANGAEKPQVTAVNGGTSSVALKSDGTGPFIIVSHEPGVKTVYKANLNWWNAANKHHNLDDAVLTTIKSAPTRVAALLSGEVDFIEPVPVQDMQRVSESPTTKVLSGPELRTIHLYMDQTRDELTYSNVKGKNPFKDVRVRKAFYEAIDIEAIKTKVMRGLSVPSAVLIAPTLYARSGEFKRPPYDPADAKKLLAEAGYPDGFELTMYCPNDRYVNDEQICQAITSMLAKVSVKVTLQAVPKAVFFAKAGPAGNFDSSFGLLGWTPSTFDSWNVIVSLAGCHSAGRGPSNYGSYCNPHVDELADKILTESDETTRNALIFDAFKILSDDVALIPMHQQAIAWGVSKKITMPVRADDGVVLADIVKAE